MVWGFIFCSGAVGFLLGMIVIAALASNRAHLLEATYHRLKALRLELYDVETCASDSEAQKSFRLYCKLERAKCELNSLLRAYDETLAGGA